MLDRKTKKKKILHQKVLAGVIIEQKWKSHSLKKLNEYESASVAQHISFRT